MAIVGGALVSKTNPIPTGCMGVTSPITITNGQSLSGEVDLGGACLLAIELPAAFTGTVLTFQASRAPGGTFKNVYDDSGSEVSVAVGAGRMVSIDTAALMLAPYRYIKVRSGTSASPTVEGADRILYVIEK